MTDPVASASPEGPELHTTQITPTLSKIHPWRVECSCGFTKDARVNDAMDLANNHSIAALRESLTLAHAREAAAREEAIKECINVHCPMCREGWAFEEPTKFLDWQPWHKHPETGQSLRCSAQRFRSLLSAPPTGTTND